MSRVRSLEPSRSPARGLSRRAEVRAGQAYRALMINLEELAATVASLGPAHRILEIGCGKGALATKLALAFPEADYLGIDPLADPGRNFRGDRSLMVFRSMLSSELLAGNPDPFDLVLVVDVLHHVPKTDHPLLLSDAAALTRPGGLVVVADWERGRGPADLFCYLTCRWLTRDRDVRFIGGPELRELVRDGLPGFENVVTTRVPPHRNNLLFALRAPSERMGA